ncbi:MAG: hypothetical protein Kow006_30200 [Gammaproteobacteria bacterium]
MVRTDRWKYVSYNGFRPQLFDLHRDPRERVDLGSSPEHEPVRGEIEARITHWLRHRRVRTTISHEDIDQRTDTAKERGIYFGVW